MKKTIGCLSLLLVMAPAIYAANLIPHNAGFEVGTGGWRYYIRESGITTPPHYDYKFILPQTLTNGAAEGRSYVRLQPDGQMGWVFEPFAVKLARGKTYTLSAWLRGEAGRIIKMGIGNDPNKEIKPSGQWERQALTFTLPGKEDVLVYPRFSGYNTALDLDGVQLEPGDKATEYQPVSSVEVSGEANKRFHLFDVGDDGKATVLVCAHGGKQRDITVKWELQDHRFVTLKKGEMTVNVVPDEPSSFELPIDTQLKGGFRIALTAKDPATGDENFFPIVYAVIPKPIPCKDISKSPFCTETYLIAGVTGNYRVYYGWASIDEFQDLMQRFGLHGSREQFWCVPQAIERAKESGKPVDWYDWWIDGLLKRNIQPYIVLLMSTANLNADGGWGETDEPYAQFSPFKIPKEDAIRYQVREIVKHFKGRVKVYEIGWETESWASPENFAKVAKWMADEVRKNDANAKVVGIVPSMDPTWADPAKREQSWLGRTLPLVKGVFDGFTAHLYYMSDPGEYSVDDPAPGMPDYDAIIGGMNELLVKNGMEPKTWSDTENCYGGATMYAPYVPHFCSYVGHDPRYVRFQAENVVRRMIVGLSLGIERWHYFIFNGMPDGNMGPFEWNMIPRPMAAAWCQMGQRIENADFAARLNAPPDVRAYLFKRDDGPCVVYWHKDCQDGAKLVLPLGKVMPGVEDIMGNPVKIKELRPGEIELPLSSSPGYIFGKGLTLEGLKTGFAGAQVSGVKRRVRLSTFGLPAELAASADTFGAVKDILHGAISSEPAAPAPVVPGYIFVLEGNRVAGMLWTKTGEGVKVDLPLAPDDIEIQNVYGRPLPEEEVKKGLTRIPLGSQPIIILSKSLDGKAMKKAFSESQVIAPPMFQVGRISMANPKPGAATAFVVPIRNLGTAPLAGAVRLSGAPADWNMPGKVSFENIGRGAERLIFFTPEKLPKLVEGVILDGVVELASGEKAQLASRAINIVRCPLAPAPALDGDLGSAEWAKANWFEVNRKEQIVVGAQWEGLKDGAMKVGIMRGEDALFLGIQVADDTVKQTAIPSELFSEDAIEVWLEAEPDKYLFENKVEQEQAGVVTFAARGDIERERRIVANAALYQVADLRNCQAAFKKTEAGYNLEILIPLNKQAIKPGTVVGFDIGFDDADKYTRKYQMIWSGYKRNSQDPSRYGFLIFD